jgi:hypothetical protein
MYIKDIQKYTKPHICPKCRYILPAIQHGSYNRERFEDHIQNCDGLNEQSVPFIPHIQKNPIFAYLLAHNRKNEYQVVQEYITFDFETVMKKETHKITEKTESYAQQLPLSVVYYVNTETEKTTRFLYRGVASNEVFINSWLNMLFNDAQQIFQKQVAYYDSLNLPDYILNKISFDKNNKYNIFVNHITDTAIHIKSVIGTETQYKSLTNSQ